MSWTTPADLKAQLARRWDRGELPRSIVTGENTFPLRLALRAPASSDLADRFDAVRHWVVELAAAPHLRIEWREVRHRIQGVQRLPVQVYVETLHDALALLDKRRDAQQLTRIVEQTRASAPTLLPWLAKRPLRALELAAEWPRILAVVRWLVDHPRPGLYLRQVDLTGVHSKFIESHRAVLAELLDLALPPEVIRHDESGVGQFARRYGFREKPPRIRFRVLDARLRLLPGGATAPDVTLDADSFACLALPVRRVFVTENEANFLAFPAVDDAIVIFGAGYGWDALAAACWLARCTCYYWGDIDTHGFAILDQLRGRLKQVSSFLMDRETLMAHEAYWGEEPDPVTRDLPRLTPDEHALYDDLRDHRIRRHLRLEQERVGFGWVNAALTRVSAPVDR